MIFNNINLLENKDDFLEKINIYIRLVETTSERNNSSINDKGDITDRILSEIINMGIIESSDDMNMLKSTIGSDFYRFINCVSFYMENRQLFGSLLYNLNNTERHRLQLVEGASEKPVFADFFAGAGGMSCGFTQAGFRVCFANDFEDVCVRTYRYNHPELPAKKVLKEDIRVIVDSINDYINQEVDVVIGGPPCQGFSSANQQRIIDDPRNELYKYYIKAVSKLLPKFVVMENVKGMLKVANQVVEDYENIHEERDGKKYTYRVAYRLLNSVNFSVAQSRERLIYIAIRDDISEQKDITPTEVFNIIDRNNLNKPHYVLNDALSFIKSLDAPRVKNSNEIDSDKTGKKIDVNDYNGDENEYLRLINNGRQIPLLYNHKARYVNDINYEIYRLLNQGDDASDEKISDIMPYKNRLHCFKDKYYKLIANKPSRTIPAHLRMDCHSHIHPFQIRAITPREAARCQSFPDDYLFLGAYLKTYMQIGNAVPCQMAKQIANVIKSFI